MRAVSLGVALLVGAAVLASAPSAGAQVGGYPAPAASTPPEAASVPGPEAWSCYGATPGPSTYASDRRPCSAAWGCRGYSWAGAGRCDGPWSGYPRCRGLSAGAGEGSYGYTRYTSSQGSPFFAPGGEAYSYAGYGGFSPSGYGAGSSSPSGVDDMRVLATGARVDPCVGPSDVPREPLAGAGPAPEGPNGTSDGR
jgi:hypothetical protein